MKDLLPGVRKPLTFAQKVHRSRTLILMCVPAILFFIAFHYLPLPGLYVAFVKYNYAKGIFGSKFVGLANFKFLFTSGRLWDLTRNTVAYNFAFLMLDNIVAIFMAILVNEIRIRWFKKITQTIMLLPYFISWVVVGVFVYNLFNYETGFIPSIVAAFGGEKPNFYGMPGAWPWIICLFNSWKWTGYNSVIYIAAITGVEGSFYNVMGFPVHKVYKELIKFADYGTER